jgi:hypothetical protein
MPRADVHRRRRSPRREENPQDAPSSQGSVPSRLLEGIACASLDGCDQGDGSEKTRQARLRGEAMRWVGAIRGGRPERAERARRDVRQRLAHQHGS